MNPSPSDRTTIERLDVEAPEEREARIRGSIRDILHSVTQANALSSSESTETILSSLNSSQNTGEATNAPISLDFGNRATFPVEPPSERMYPPHVRGCSWLLMGLTFFLVLARIEAFLPALEASNSQLLQQAENDPRSVDIEHLNREEGRYIQMVHALSRNHREAG